MKKLAKVVVCPGAAHSNPFIDNCMICMPRWGTVALCPVDLARLTPGGFCRECRKYYKEE